MLLQSVQLHQEVFRDDADVPVLLSDPPAVSLILLETRQYLSVCLFILNKEKKLIIQHIHSLRTGTNEHFTHGGR